MCLPLLPGVNQELLWDLLSAYEVGIVLWLGLQPCSGRKRPSPSCCSVTGDSLVFTLDSLGLLPLDSIIFKGFFNLKNFVIQLVEHWLSLKKPILRGL